MFRKNNKNHALIMLHWTSAIWITFLRLIGDIFNGVIQLLSRIPAALIFLGTVLMSVFLIIQSGPLIIIFIVIIVILLLMLEDSYVYINGDFAQLGVIWMWLIIHFDILRNFNFMNKKNKITH